MTRIDVERVAQGLVRAFDHASGGAGSVAPGSPGVLAGEIESIDPRHLARVDAALRWSAHDHRSRFAALRPDAFRDSALREEATPAVALACCHASGWIREAALRSLAGTSSALALRFIVLRLNDWVPQVRDAARVALEPYLASRHARALLDSLVLFEDAAKATRADHSATLARVRATLEDPGSRQALIEATRGGWLATRERALALAVRVEGGDRVALLASALRDASTRIRSWAIRRVADEGDVSSRIRLARIGLTDRSAGVRWLALHALSRDLGPVELEPLIRAALLDPSALVRWPAQKHSRLVPAIGDLRDFYLGALRVEREPRIVRAALLGLADLGREEDADVVLAFIDASHQRVRRVAIRAVGRLAPKKSRELLLGLIASESSPISREACRALRPHASLLDASRLRRLVGDEGAPLHARRNALELAAVQSKWTALETLLQAAQSQNEEIAATSHAQLVRWNDAFNRSAVLPGRAQLVSLEALLDEVGPSAEGWDAWSLRLSLEALRSRVR